MIKVNNTVIVKGQQIHWKTIHERREEKGREKRPSKRNLIPTLQYREKSVLDYQK